MISLDDIARALTPPENTVCSNCQEKVDPVSPRWRRSHVGWEHQCKNFSQHAAIGEAIQMATPSCPTCDGPVDPKGRCTPCDEKRDVRRKK